MYRLKCDLCGEDINTKTLFKVLIEEIENKDYFDKRRIIAQKYLDLCHKCRKGLKC